MLSEETLDILSERLANRIEKVNTEIIKSIGKSIKQIGTLNYTQAKQLEQILIYGGDYKKIEKEISKVTELNIKEIDKIFKEVAKKDLQFAKQFYKYRNIPFIPYEENIEFKEQVEAIKLITQNKYINIANTQMIGFIINDEFKPLKKAYIEALDIATLNVSQGKETFDSAMKKLLKNLGNGLVTYDSGKTMRLDSAVRMNLKGALTDLHNQTQITLGKQFDADGVEINVHENPAPDHQEVQGKQFSLEEYDNFQNDRKATSYDGQVFEHEYNGHDRRSIGEYNCYHYIFSIILGTKPEYSKKELKKIINNNNEGFKLDGKHYTMYQGTQIQRKLETEIRKQKDTQILAKTTDNKELLQESQSKINDLTTKYNELCNVSGLKRKIKRLSVSGYKKTKV